MVKRSASNKLRSQLHREPRHRRLRLKLLTQAVRPERSSNAPEETLFVVCVCGRRRFSACRVHGWTQLRARHRAHYCKVGRFGTMAPERSERRRPQGRMVERLSRRRTEWIGEGFPGGESDAAGGDWKL